MLLKGTRAFLVRDFGRQRDGQSEIAGNQNGRLLRALLFTTDFHIPPVDII